MCPEICELRKRAEQFLVHSFLYYQLDETLISDDKYDEICKDLGRLLTEAPQECRQFQNYNLVMENLGEDGSGFSLKKDQYPIRTVSMALRLLHQHQDPGITFDLFAARLGYQMQDAASQGEN